MTVLHNKYRKFHGGYGPGQGGQAMAEYIVVLAFGIMVLLGPGRDIMARSGTS